MVGLERILTLPSHWEICSLESVGNTLHLYVTSQRIKSRCPSCGFESHHIHSHYERSPQDLPCVGKNLRFHLTVARFRCANPNCRRATFSEQSMDFLPKSSRCTTRLNQLLQEMGFEVGGQAGVRLAHYLQIQTSRHTVLRRVRRTVIQVANTVQILGIDDWAYCLARDHRHSVRADRTPLSVIG